MKRYFAFLISVLLFSVLFAVVSDLEAFGLKSRIIGKWFTDKGQIEFLKDGTIIWVSNEIGDYKFIDDNRLRVDIKGTAAMVFEVSIDKEGALILKDPAGRGIGFLREKAYKIYKAKLEAQKKAEEDARRRTREERLKAKFQLTNLTVLDKETKLMWTKDGNIAGKGMGWDDAFEFIKKLNEQKYAGYSDWRLFANKDIENFINFARSQGYSENFDRFFNEIGFKIVPDGSYWASTINTGREGNDWVVHMRNGNIYTSSIRLNGLYYVWPVRGGQ